MVRVGPAWRAAPAPGQPVPSLAGSFGPKLTVSKNRSLWQLIRCSGALFCIVCATMTVGVSGGAAFGAPGVMIAGNTPESIDQRPAGPFEDQAIPLTSNRAGNPASRPAANLSQDHFGIGRLLLALGLVLGLILLFQRLGKRFLGSSGSLVGHRAMRVIARTAIAPRQQLLLVQVGQRLLVVGNSGPNMSRLCEIRNPDEVSALLAQVRAEPTLDAAKAFGSLFGRAGKRFEAPAVSDAEPKVDAQISQRRPSIFVSESAAPMDDASDDMQLPDGVVETTSVDGGPVGSEGKVADTRRELAGLMDKVRQVSQQFQQG